MLSVREFISDVRNSLRTISVDAWISAKYIHRKGLDIASLYIKREADDKRLFRYTELWTTIPCFKLKEEDLIKCCDIVIPSCKKVMRSIHKLPDSYSTRFGYLLNVSSVDYDRDYIQTTPKEYKRTLTREYKDKNARYFWIDNGHVIVPVSNDMLVFPERLTVRGMFINKAEALRLDCNAPSCVNFMDQEFIAPEHLIQDIKTSTIAEIMNTYKRLVPDEFPNNNENEKTSQP